MKNLLLLVIISGCFIVFSCKEKESDRFKFLTDTTWRTDSLLVNGIDATGPGGLLEDFIGDTKFNKDGTGSFGEYTGIWRFSAEETKLVIETDSLPLPIIADIKELTSNSLKLTTALPNPANPLGSPLNIRMTFKPK